MVDCACPYAAEHESRRKHIWATLVAAQARIARSWGTPPRTVRVTCSDDDAADDQATSRTRELAAAIVRETSGPLAAMTRDDLEWLLC